MANRYPITKRRLEILRKELERIERQVNKLREGDEIPQQLLLDLVSMQSSLLAEISELQELIGGRFRLSTLELVLSSIVVIFLFAMMAVVIQWNKIAGCSWLPQVWHQSTRFLN